MSAARSSIRAPLFSASNALSPGGAGARAKRISVLVEALRRRFALAGDRGASARGARREPGGRGSVPRADAEGAVSRSSSFQDMDIAARVIEDAIVSGRAEAVLADYDVDGGSSAAQLVRYFRARGRKLKIYVPDRMKEGYGPSALAFERLKAEGVELVITVDCGAAAEGAAQRGRRLGPRCDRARPSLDGRPAAEGARCGQPQPARRHVGPRRISPRPVSCW